MFVLRVIWKYFYFLYIFLLYLYYNSYYIDWYYFQWDMSHTDMLAQNCMIFTTPIKLSKHLTETDQMLRQISTDIRIALQLQLYSSTAIQLIRYIAQQFYSSTALQLCLIVTQHDREYNCQVATFVDYSPTGWSWQDQREVDNSTEITQFTDILT